MSNWTYTARTESDVTYVDQNGQTVTRHMRPGDVFETDNACEMIRFVNGSSRSVSEQRPGVVDELNRECGATAAPSTDPTAGGQPGASDGNPGTEDSAQRQGAPTTDTGGTTNGEHEPSPTDARPPADQMADATRPASEHETRETRRAQGASDAEADEAVERGRRNEPMPGEEHPTHGGEHSRAPQLGGDPVQLFDGRLALAKMDLDAGGAILPLQLTRCYRSGRPYFGPFGYGWDHSYNVFVRELKDGRVARWTGALVEDLFVPTGAGFEPPRGLFERLDRLTGPGLTYVITKPGGLLHRFERPPGWTDAERIPLVEIRDRFGNHQRLHYDTRNHLIRVEDQEGRALIFRYGQCDLLERVEDHTGRHVEYHHADDIEHLVAVVQPASPGYPEGVVVRYEYAPPASHPAMRHNILRVIDPDGRTYLQNFYQEDPSGHGWNRVCRQLLGDFPYEYEYEQLQYVPDDAAFVDIGSSRTTVREPDGGLHFYTFNYRGDLIDHRFRLVRDGSYRVVARQWRYDSAGNTIAEVAPDGGQRLSTYDHANPDPTARGNLLRVELTARAGFPAPSRITFRATYEPRFQLVRESSDETGAQTRYIYDLQTSPGPQATGRLERLELPDATLPDGSIQTSHHRFESDVRGRITAHVTPEGSRTELEYGTAGNGRGRLTNIRHDATGASIRFGLEYDALGRTLSTRNGAGAVTTHEYTPLGWLSRVVLPPVNGRAADCRASYNGDGHAVAIRRPRGSYQDPAMTDDFIEDVIERSVLGHVRRVVLGNNTSSPRIIQQLSDHRGAPGSYIDPTGRERRLCHDERGQLLREEQVGEDGSRSASRRVYDRTGRLQRFIEGPAEDRLTQFEYDAFGRIQKTVLPNGSIREQVWGPRDLLLLETLTGDPGDGTSRLLSQSGYEHDERGRLMRVTRKSFVSDPTVAVDLVETLVHDRDDRVSEHHSARGGVTRFGYDGLGRLTEETDPHGNILKVVFNALDLPTLVERRDIESTGTVVRRWQAEYDERGRLIRSIEPDGTSATTEYDDRDEVVKEIDALGVVRVREVGLLGELILLTRDPGGLNLVQRWSHDLAGRPVRHVDPTGEVSTCAFDGIGRPFLSEPAGGARSLRTFGPSGRLESERFASGVELTFRYDSAGRLAEVRGAGAGIAPLGPHTFRYDGADRVVEAATPTVVVRRAYDSLGRLSSEDMFGASLTARHDDLAGTVALGYSDGRIERLSLNHNEAALALETTASGTLGAGPAALARFSVAGGDRMEAVTLPGGSSSTLTFDARNRVSDVRHVSGAGLLHATSYRYDAVNQRRVVVQQATSTTRWLHRFDAASRLRRSATGFTAPALSAVQTQVQHDVAIASVEAAAAAAARVLEQDLDDSDGRRVLRETGNSDITYAHAPGHRIATAGAEVFSHDVDGARRSDGARVYDVDALGRIVRVKDTAGSELLALEYDAFGRIAARTAAGTTRQLRYFGTQPREELRAGALSRQFSPHPFFGFPAFVHTPGQSFTLLYDGHFDLVAALASDGSVRERYSYLPFGQPTILAPGGAPRSASAIDVEPVFGGMPFALEAQLYLAQARLFDPRHGLFLTPDPMGFVGGPNLYAFAGQNPVDRIDPEGDLFWFVLGVIAVGALVGGGANAARQGVQIAEGSRTNFSWGEVGTSALWGGALAPAVVFAPEVTIPVLTTLGVASAADQFAQGNYATGTFDAVMAVAPFGSKTVRGSVFGRGSLIGQWRGLGPMDGLSARLGRFQRGSDFVLPRGSRAPGVRVTRVDFEGRPAWEKSVSTRMPGLRWWAELTIRRQEAALQRLAERGVPAARVLRPYERGGSLIIEDAGPLASDALRANPTLRTAYDAYYREAARGLGWPRLGRIPLVRQLLHDLRPDNIGYSPEQGFRAFDPALDPVTLGVATAGGLALAGGLIELSRHFVGTAHGQPLPTAPPAAATPPRPDKK